MSSRRSIVNALDRPGSRWLLGLLCSAYFSWKAARIVTVRHRNGMWIHRERDGMFAAPTPTQMSHKTIEKVTDRDYFFTYRPQPGDVAVDVGAGFGTEALALSRIVGPTGRVIAVEAHPQVFACLQATIVGNTLENVTCINVAAADVARDVRISDRANFASNSLIEFGGLQVTSATLDDVLRAAGVEHIDFLKMNIEGAETLALRGLDVLADNIEHAAICCHDFVADATGNDQMRTKQTVAEWLAARGFTVTHRDDPLPGNRDTLYADRATR